MRKGTRLPMEALRPYLIETPAPAPGQAPLAKAELLDWKEIFGNAHPVEVEVGSGKGLFLQTAAQGNPDTNYLGIEIVRKYQLYIATRMAKRELRNVRVTCADARLLLRDRVAEMSVQTVHVYFPDPWWKTRHHKRRVFTLEFAQQCARILRDGGQLLVATDVPDYAAMVKKTAALVPSLREAKPPAEHQPAHDLDYLTNFERKFRRQGKEIHRMAFERVLTSNGSEKTFFH